MSDVRTLVVPAEAAGQRLDHFLANELESISRSRVQLLLEQGDVLLNGTRPKASRKLRGGEQIVVTGDPHPAPLKAIAEEIPLDVVYEDADLAVVNKPAGMMAAWFDRPTMRGAGGHWLTHCSTAFARSRQRAEICARASCTGSTRRPAA